jgi:hypothetical protein
VDDFISTHFQLAQNIIHCNGNTHYACHDISVIYPLQKQNTLHATSHRLYCVWHLMQVC